MPHDANGRHLSAQLQGASGPSHAPGCRYEGQVLLSEPTRGLLGLSPRAGRQPGGCEGRTLAMSPASVEATKHPRVHRAPGAAGVRHAARRPSGTELNHAVRERRHRKGLHHARKCATRARPRGAKGQPPRGPVATRAARCGSAGHEQQAPLAGRQQRVGASGRHAAAVDARAPAAAGVPVHGSIRAAARAARRESALGDEPVMARSVSHSHATIETATDPRLRPGTYSHAQPVSAQHDTPTNK